MKQQGITFTLTRDTLLLLAALAFLTVAILLAVIFTNRPLPKSEPEVKVRSCIAGEYHPNDTDNQGFITIPDCVVGSTDFVLSASAPMPIVVCAKSPGTFTMNQEDAGKPFEQPEHHYFHCIGDDTIIGPYQTLEINISGKAGQTFQIYAYTDEGYLLPSGHFPKVYVK